MSKSAITADTTLEEIATLVSEALESAGIPAVLSGGGAVSHYSHNEYMTTDLDFVSNERFPMCTEAECGCRHRQIHQLDSKRKLASARSCV